MAKISIIRPGAVETKKLSSTIDKSCAVVQEKSDVNVWVKSVIDTFTQHTNIHIKEISIGHITQRIPLYWMLKNFSQIKVFALCHGMDLNWNQVEL